MAEHGSATWGVALVIDNDEQLYRERIRIVARAVRDAELSIEVDDAVREWVEKVARIDSSSPALQLSSQLVSCALGQVDWQELVNDWASEDDGDDTAEAWAKLRAVWSNAAEHEEFGR